jgi:hypothetical protein
MVAISTMTAAEPARTVLSVRIGEGGHQTDRLGPLLARARELESPTALMRAEAEIAAVHSAGLGAAFNELVAMAEDWRGSGTRIEAIGKFASLFVLHLAGLTAINPLDHGLLAETYLDIAEKATNTLPNVDGRRPWPVLAVRLTHGLDDFLVYLRRQGYSFRTTRVGNDTPCNKIIAGRGHPYGNRVLPTLLIQTGSDLLAAESLRPEEMTSCLYDARAFQLLAAGDTDGIGQLESEDNRELLRRIKPTTIEMLARVLSLKRAQTVESQLAPLYREDAMLDLREMLGISLSDARELLDGICRSGALGLEYRDWFIDTATSRGMPGIEATEQWTRLQESVRSMSHKATILVKAHRYLRAAYLKAHFPEDFRALATAVEFPR